MFAGTVRQDCQPPVLATPKLPIGALPRESSRTSTRPLIPPAAPEATRAMNWVAAVDPKSTPSYRAQSPFARLPRFCPPPVSLQASVIVPDCALSLSAWIVAYALREPDGGLDDGVGDGGGVDDEPLNGRFSTDWLPTPSVLVPEPIALHTSTFTRP